MLTVVETLLFQRQWPMYRTKRKEELSQPISRSALLPEMSCPNPVAFVKSAGVEQFRASQAVFG